MRNLARLPGRAALLVLPLLALAPLGAAQGARTIAPIDESPWAFEVFPYVWGVGIDADLQVHGNSASVDVGFDDLLDAADFGGGIAGTVQYERWITGVVVDYLKLSTSNVDDTPSGGSLDSDALLLGAGVGCRFEGPLEGSFVDVLGGLRYVDIDNELEIDGVGTFDKRLEILDPMLFVRPSLPLTERLRLNPNLALGGGGDSDLVYELWPQLLYYATDSVTLRLGYRQLHYEIDEGDNEFDGDFKGLLFGVGWYF